MTKSPVHCALQGLCIMVTRPVQLADRLSKLCTEQGAAVIRFPCMEIIDAAHSESNLNKVKQLDKYSLLIFISRNAVHYGMQLLHKVRIHKMNMPIAAVGVKTAEALAAAGIPNAMHPRDATSSEALAATEFIQNMTHGSVLIFRGKGGNPYLGKQLRRQGLKVDYAEVYRRQKPKRHLRLDQNLNPDLITAASGETLTNLYEMTKQSSIAALLDRQLLLGSSSMEELHARLGFKPSPIVARSPIDDDMFRAIMKHYE